MTRREIPLLTPADTRALGRSLGRAAGPGSVLLLTGPVGAGKTTLAQAVLAAWVGVEDAPSPTFTLVHSYPGEVHHVDLYRLAQGEAGDLGLEEILTPTSRLVVEWPDRAHEIWPADRLEIALGVDGQHRRAVVRGTGPKGEAVVWALDGAGSEEDR